MITVPQPLGEVDDELLLETLLPLVDGFGEDELASDEDPDSNFVVGLVSPPPPPHPHLPP